MVGAVVGAVEAARVFSSVEGVTAGAVAGAKRDGAADGTAATAGIGLGLTTHGPAVILLASSKLHFSSTAAMHKGLKDLN